METKTHSKRQAEIRALAAAGAIGQARAPAAGAMATAIGANSPAQHIARMFFAVTAIFPNRPYR